MNNHMKIQDSITSDFTTFLGGFDMQLLQLTTVYFSFI